MGHIRFQQRYSWCHREEKGVFYALDMGGTNFRVVTIHLSKRKNRVVSTRRCSFDIRLGSVLQNSVSALCRTVACAAQSR